MKKRITQMLLKSWSTISLLRCRTWILIILLVGLYWLFIMEAISLLPFVKDCFDPNTDCEDNMACLIGKCNCKSGFYKSQNNSCIDIDECSTEPCGSKEQCLNTHGSYKCNCIEDYKRLGTNCVYDPKECKVENSIKFKHCRNKINWLQKFWGTDHCYRQFGVTGSNCSFVVYMSEVERECPLLPGRKLRKDSGVPQVPAEIVDDINFLTNFILYDKENEELIINRIKSTWYHWRSAAQSLALKQNLSGRPIKRIIVFVGILIEKRWGWAKNAKKGGPLGELVQWSDIIAAIYLLGHKIFIPSSIRDLKSGNKRKIFGCGPTKVTIEDADIIYADTHGVNLLRKEFGIHKFGCKLRIVDSFGTEARFNHVSKPDDFDETFSQMWKKISKNKYGYFDFKVHLNQIMTMFPHSPDNCFLGFAAGSNENIPEEIMKHKTVALVYGKLNSHLKGLTDVLDTINQYIPVDATIQLGKNQKIFSLPSFVKNHGVLKWEKFQSLLRNKVKIFIGLGFPFEGPGPLEAIMHGAVFLNPILQGENNVFFISTSGGTSYLAVGNDQWNPPLSTRHDKKFSNKWFFEGKPFLREFKSQHSYFEKYVGSPNSYNVNYENKTELEAILKEILENFQKKLVKPYIPYEFTHEGFLQRINSFINRQNFCSHDMTWIPRENLINVKSHTNESCKTACSNRGLICENSLFLYVNMKSSFEERELECMSVVILRSYHAPFYETKTGVCHLQRDRLFYSCVDSAENYRRLCPCRRYIKNQIALYYNYY